VSVLAPLVVLHLAPIREDVNLVSAQLDVQPLIKQFLIIPDVFQPGDVISKDAKMVLACVKTQPLAQILLFQAAIAVAARF